MSTTPPAPRGEPGRLRASLPQRGCRSCGVALGQLRGPAFAGLCPRCLLADALSGGSTSEERLAAQASPAPALERIGPYRLRRCLGTGAMGAVYVAQHQGGGAEVALKVLTPPYRPATLERFRREVETLRRLDHPNVVRIHSAQEADGFHFFTMDLVLGPTLADKIARDLPPPRWAAATLRTLALALHYVHQQGVVHRDLKPGNILLGYDGIPRIVDFGLARDLRGGPPLTRSGATLGTGPYMAPEQVQATPGKVDARSDTYGLGAILYECLTGVPPFLAENLWETLRMVQQERPTPPRQHRPEVEPDLEAICLLALEKDPARRYPTALALAQDLARYLEGGPVAARGPARARRLALGLLLGGALLATGLVLSAPRPAPPAAPPTPAQEAEEALRQARELRAGGELEAALAAAERALSLAPEAPDPWWLRGSLRGQLGEPVAALDDLRRALELGPDRAAIWDGYGFALSRLGRSAEALAAYDRSLALDPDQPEALNSRAVCLLHLGRRDEALRDLDRLLSARPEHVSARNNRAGLRAERGDPGGALEDLNEALRQAPDDPGILASRGALLARLGRLEEAMRELERATTVAPGSVHAWELLSQVRAELGDLAGALEAIERALMLEPNRATALEARGQTHAARGDLARAEVDFGRAAELLPAWSEPLLLRGELRQRQGRLEEALGDYTEALRRGALPLAPVQARRAVILAALGRAEEARGEAAEALRGLAQGDPRRAELEALLEPR